MVRAHRPFEPIDERRVEATFYVRAERQRDKTYVQLAMICSSAFKLFSIPSIYRSSNKSCGKHFTRVQMRTR